MMTDREYTPKRAMVIVAHPDDVEWCCAGTIAKWVQVGATAAYILATSGEAGITEVDISIEQAARIREAEALEAAKVAGVEDVTFLREPDGLIENTLALRKRLVREIRRFRPEVVITSDPMMLFFPTGGINHPDHRAISAAAVDAIFPTAGQPSIFPEFASEGFNAHKVRKLYLVGMGEGETCVDITGTLDIKIEALRKHVSQVGQWKGLADSIAGLTAQAAQGQEMAHAEDFRVITLEGDNS